MLFSRSQMSWAASRGSCTRSRCRSWLFCAARECRHEDTLLTRQFQNRGILYRLWKSAFICAYPRAHSPEPYRAFWFRRPSLLPRIYRSNRGDCFDWDFAWILFEAVQSTWYTPRSWTDLWSWLEAKATYRKAIIKKDWAYSFSLVSVISVQNTSSFCAVSTVLVKHSFASYSSWWTIASVASLTRSENLSEVEFERSYVFYAYAAFFKWKFPSS